MVFSYSKVLSTNRPCDATTQGGCLGFSTSLYSFPPLPNLVQTSTSTTEHLRPTGSLLASCWTLSLSMFYSCNLSFLITRFIQLGKLIAFAEFDSHLLVFREICLEIYPVLTLPEEGQSTTLKPIQMFFLQFPIQSPVVCSPCTPLNLPDSDFALPSTSKRMKVFSKSICYRISGTREIRGSILTRNTDIGTVNAPPFRLIRNPSIAARDCSYVRVGNSGRGFWLDSSNNVFRCHTVSMVMSGGGEYSTLDMGQWNLTPLCTLPQILRDHDGDWALDFDEGMCRIVFCNQPGLVSIVDVV